MIHRPTHSLGETRKQQQFTSIFCGSTTVRMLAIESGEGNDSHREPYLGLLNGIIPLRIPPGVVLLHCQLFYHSPIITLLSILKRSVAKVNIVNRDNILNV